MRNFILALYGLMVLFVACENDEFASDAEPVQKNSEVFTLNSKENNGFSVERLKMADFPKTDADFIIIPQTSMTGDVMSPFLSNPNLEKRFFLSSEFEDGKSAEAYFDTYNTYPQGMEMKQFALNLKPHQVWLVSTRSGSFCKVWIIDTRVDKKTSFVEIKFKAERLI